MDDQDKQKDFSKFSLVADFNALVIFSAIPILMMLPIYGLAVGVTFGTTLGGCLLLTAMADEEFRAGYQQGVREEYEEYLENKDS